MMRGKNKTFRRIIGLIIIAAWVTPEVVVGFCWVAFLGDNGTLNMLAHNLLGMKPVAWLYTFPMVSIIIANVWRGTASAKKIPYKPNRFDKIRIIGIKIMICLNNVRMLASRTFPMAWK